MLFVSLVFIKHSINIKLAIHKITVIAKPVERTKRQGIQMFSARHKKTPSRIQFRLIMSSLPEVIHFKRLYDSVEPYLNTFTQSFTCTVPFRVS